MTEADDERRAFLPDFCEPGNLLRTIVFAELLAVVLTAVHPGPMPERLVVLGLLSLLIQWIAVTDIALLCAVGRWLARLEERVAAVAAFVLLQVVTVGFTVIGHAVMRRVAGGAELEPLTVMLAEHGIVSVIVSALALRYFYVTAQWRRNIEAEAQARVQALQARIRPHFLFNSMNTIASLTRDKPEQAEAAVEDLAELFRASLAERSMLDISEELELVASYLRIEKERLGSRLQVEWSIGTEPGDADMPALTLQPLVENAVYHGIERLGGGGRIGIESWRDADGVCVRIRNPVSVDGGRARGNRVAQENVRQRLALAFGGSGSMDIAMGDQDYVVTVCVPAKEDS